MDTAPGIPLFGSNPTGSAKTENQVYRRLITMSLIEKRELKRTDKWGQSKIRFNLTPTPFIELD
ncbi:MAG: hypothetical protein D3909_07230 [Candidatus Electrothrix sp. ATG1]|nr:hypothetical protein [Candidatus Electrothrix sp. ATG1]